MNKREYERLAHQESALLSLGFTADEAAKLRRISNTLRRWYELECNGEVERDEDTGRVRGYNPNARYLDPHDPRAYYRISDRERGAEKRLGAIIGQRNGRPAIVNERLNANPAGKLTSYLQTDPRGAALYILRPGDVPSGEDDSAYYNRGICVY